MHDREELDDGEVYEPWYIAPEITSAEQHVLFSTKSGPHPDGAFHDHRGQLRGVE
jgi:hypothetical protein